MVIRPGVNRPVDHIRIKSYVLHDVDLTVVRPTTITITLKSWKHPDRGPGTSTRGQLSSYLNSPVRPISLAFRDQPRRSVIALLPILPACFNNELSILDARIFSSLRRIVLQLSIAPA